MSVTALLIFAPAQRAGGAASRSHLKSSDNIPVATPGIILELLDCVAGRDALNSPLLGRNMLIARYNEQV